MQCLRHAIHTRREEREREKAARHTEDNPEEELNLIGDDEIEAMRREAEEEERKERQAEVPSCRMSCKTWTLVQDVYKHPHKACLSTS